MSRLNSMIIKLDSGANEANLTVYYHPERTRGREVTLHLMMGVADAHLRTTRDGLAELHHMLGDALATIDAQQAATP